MVIYQFLSDNGICVGEHSYQMTPGVMQRVAEEFCLEDYAHGDPITLLALDGVEIAIEVGTVN